MHVEIWSDVVCPWCAVGKARFETALGSFEHRDDVTVRWRSFELDPDAPSLREGTYVERLASKYRTSLPQAQAMIDRMTETAASVGLDFDFERARPGNTFDAHRLLHLAADRQRQGEVKARFFAGYLTEGQPIGDPEALRAMAVEAGLDGSEVEAVLGGDRYADAVRADQRQAMAYGIHGVPFFVIDRTLGVSGAQPPEVLRQALDQAWAQSHPLTMVGEVDAAACDDDSCAV